MELIVVGIVCWMILAKAAGAPPVAPQAKGAQHVTLNPLNEDRQEVLVRGYQAGHIERRGSTWIAVSKAGKERGFGTTPMEAANMMIDSFEVSRPGNA